MTESMDLVEVFARELHAGWPDCTRSAYLRRAERILAVVRPVIEAAERASVAETLRHAATGRREYLACCPDIHRQALESEIATIEACAEVAAGSDGPLYTWLPSWRWSPQMHRKLDEGRSRG